MLLEVWRGAGGYYADYMDRLGRHRRYGLIAHTPAEAADYIIRLLQRHTQSTNRLTVITTSDLMNIVAQRQAESAGRDRESHGRTTAREGRRQGDEPNEQREGDHGKTENRNI